MSTPFFTYLKIKVSMTSAHFSYLIGLGNKDPSFSFTRHNIGYLFLGYLHSNFNFPHWQTKKSWNSLVSNSKHLTLIKPRTYMNLSGLVIKKIYSSLPPHQRNQILIIHDDLDIPLGKWKLSFAKGPKQHNGILSIEHQLNTKDFWRLRIGIDNRATHPTPTTGADYVLSRFTPDELTQLNQSIFPSILDYLKPHLPYPIT